MQKPCCCGKAKACCESKPAHEDPVHAHYSSVAKEGADPATATSTALKAGYTKEDLAMIPPEASLGLGCGNSVAAAALKEGEAVLDLGCGAGMDLFLSGAKVGPKGRAVGVDFSADMVKRGKEVAAKYGRKNVEFHESPIEKMPFPDNTFDVVISNCVLNLVPDKDVAFKEICRVLKKGGRFVVSDIVLRKEPPAELRQDVAALVGCFARAMLKDEYEKRLLAAGFGAVSMDDKKLDLMALYSKPGFEGGCTEGMCCGKGIKLDKTILMKYNLNEYAMSCVVRASKST